MTTFKNIVGTLSFLALVIGFSAPMAARAATSPGLGAAASYSVIGGSIVTNSGATTMPGDLGISPAGAVPHFTGFPPGVVTTPGAIHDADVGAGNAQAANTAAFTTIDQGCDATFAGVKDLSTVSPLGPGVYCATAFTLTGNLTLTGSGVWIFKSASTLITSPGSSVTGGDPCNIWWRVVSSATIDTTTHFEGNILALTSISVNNGAIINGRLFAQTGAVTLINDTITNPVCSIASAASASRTGTIVVIKNVINDNCGTKISTAFPLFVNNQPVVSGVPSTFPAPANAYTVTETADPNYTATFSGDCDPTGGVSLSQGDVKYCVITNNDIGVPLPIVPVPPLIDVIKVPSPLALPDGPGNVTYTYTLKNIGTVPVTDITMVGDTCSPIVLASGDTNSDNKLQVNETWVYRCSTNLTETHTNTVTATGWANGISTTDVASATVVVGIPVIPPLIHVTKIPNPLTLKAGGGMVTYTEKITNPGTVALSNVTLTDDKCTPLRQTGGDTNNDALLDPTETWTYTCATNLTQTTTNTAIASGTANGMTVRDLAVATVVVAAIVPKLPNTGFTPANSLTAIITTLGAGLIAAYLLYAASKKQKA